MEALRSGYKIPFHSVPPLSGSPIALDSYSSQSIKGRALEEEIQALCRKGAIEPASLSPGYYSHMFVVTEASGGWRPSTLNLSVVKTQFCMETAQSVLRSVRRNDWMVSIDLNDAYLQIPIHPSSRLAVQGPLLRSVHCSSGVYTGHSSSVQFLSSVRSSDASLSGRMADFSVVSQGSLLGKGQGPESLLRTRDNRDFGQVFARSVSVSGLSGDQDRVTDFPGFADSLEDRKVLLNSRRISVLKGAVCEVLESPARPPRVSDASCSGKLPSHESSSVSSQAKLGISRRLGLDPLGLPFLGRSSVVVCRGSSRGGCFAGRSLSRPHVLVGRFGPGLGSHSCGPVRVRTLGGGGVAAFSQPSRATHSAERSPCIQSPSPGSGNTTVVSYLRCQGGTYSSVLNGVVQDILRWAESQEVSLLPQFVLGHSNIVADSLSLFPFRC